MSYKKFRVLSFVIVAVVLVAAVCASVMTGRTTALAAVVVATILVGVAFSHMKEVTTDERDLADDGRAARTSMALLVPLGAVVAGTLIGFRDYNPTYLVIGSTIAYSVCALMLAHQGVYLYLTRKSKVQ
jgi:uncharacterized membrane protein